MSGVAIASTAIVLVGLAALAVGPEVARLVRPRRRERRLPRPAAAWDPGRELRAERKARELLRAVVSSEEFDAYDELGFLSVPGAGDSSSGYAYLIYPHRPIVAYDSRSGEPLSEYCVAFPDRSEPALGERLPDADDVLAKWMALHGDERELIATANMHVPGRQVDPGQVRRDLRRLREWRAAKRPGGVSPSKRASAAALGGRLRRSRPRRRPRLHEGDRLRRRRAQPADDRDRQHLDRGDAVQLPPPRPRRARQGGRARRRRHADGVQHDRDLRRDHDGHRRG